MSILYKTLLSTSFHIFSVYFSCPYLSFTPPSRLGMQRWKSPYVKACSASFHKQSHTETTLSQQFASRSTQGFIQWLLLFKTGSRADSRVLLSLLPKYSFPRFLTFRGQTNFYLPGSSPQRHVYVSLFRDHHAPHNNSNLHHVFYIYSLAYYLTAF